MGGHSPEDPIVFISVSDYYLQKSRLFVEIKFVELAVLVLALLDEGAAAVYVYVEILVKLDYAFIEAVLLFYRSWINIKLVLQLHLTFLLISVTVIIKHTHHLGLSYYLLLETLHVKLGGILKIVHGTAQQIGLVGTVQIKLLGQFLCYKVSGKVHYILGLEI